ncbi:hypothetical protein CANCADRAFT_104477 [Tortispora caseinolytica NRRL Y-17796]|uniref:U3 small nucleolar RNA-associated protein 6 N-terminal domain-containing protein n=1 Tax=Tortispora caseinolytica NRRL Y-17796 TaxID=767744 RepID=A0A1E4TES2_9ASCO|nr:hypothetical protein CANCADRAFT_104477 [Tortispora caseinolytica NRRL Y-17796]
MSEKARFFIEKSIPELKDLEKKGIFNKDELNRISKKRMEFENRINNRGSKVKDFQLYIEYEKNIEELKKSRRSKKNIDTKSAISNWSGARRINFIFERALRKFPGNTGLWIEAIEYARSQKMFKIINNLINRMLKLHPKKPELWIFAASYEIDDNSDIIAARRLLQNGLKFNNDSIDLWCAYGHLELSYIVKILLRRKILGIDNEDNTQTKDEDESTLLLPETELDLPDIEVNVLGSVDQNPALQGSVVKLVFDSGMKVFNFSQKSALKFTKAYADTICEFADSTIDVWPIYDYVITTAFTEYSSSADLGYLYCISPLQLVAFNTSEFVKRLRISAQRAFDLKKSLDIAREYSHYLTSLLTDDTNKELKESITAIAESIISK